MLSTSTKRAENGSEKNQSKQRINLYISDPNGGAYPNDTDTSFKLSSFNTNKICSNPTGYALFALKSMRCAITADLLAQEMIRVLSRHFQLNLKKQLNVNVD